MLTLHFIPIATTAGMLYRPFTGGCALGTACRVEGYAYAPRVTCDNPVHLGGLVPEEFLTVMPGNGYTRLVDIEQYEAFEKEYKEVPQDRRYQFLADRRLQVRSINEVFALCDPLFSFLLIALQHASKCVLWHEDMVQAHKDEQGKAKLARAERWDHSVASGNIRSLMDMFNSLFNRLKNLGYTSELDYFGTDPIKDAHRSIFNSTKALTDQEWVHVRGQFVTTMNDYRTRRLEKAVYNPRRQLLVELYDAYVRQPAPPGATVDLLPDVVDLAHFAAFDAIIQTPEGTEVNGETFKPPSNRSQTLVQEWRADVKDAQLRLSVVIPTDPH
ncbi:hypothetical protein BU15DRAFT_82712 [Melanogaster broomeanus]|nr:hypothetical protein BU15DRAFT_82712 [Melanogaster broomeanus]